MIRNTFQHISGYGKIRELELWKSGINNWDEYVKRQFSQREMFESATEIYLLQKSFDAYERGDADFFASGLSPREYYRIALSFPEDVMFLDIETTGLSRYYDHITLIGWSFLNEFDVYYQGLTKEPLIAAFKRAKAVVTFNGAIFDLPFIAKEFPELSFPLCHIDLRFFSRRFGFSGGQKNIEREIGFQRSAAAEKVTGEMAPVLWHQYKEGRSTALRRLITYNQFDIDGMKYLLDICVAKSIQSLEYLSPPPSTFKFSDFPSTTRFSKQYEVGKIFIRPFDGKLGPAITLRDLPKHEDLNIVGIDLTGSEERATGWCHLHYNQAKTRRINSDHDLIEETLKTNPDIVSIDSPLSIPFGRISVFDDDPGRYEFGIMRICERILKSRGVNVYPSLIPSMQKLTKRGILLANEFRKRGIAVIESYPGAAQDILGIPRKRASLEYLVKGLRDFGIRGKFIRQEVSHDELDAITSAMLGYFFWCGKFEALGNNDEDYLIIPDIHQVFPDWQGKHVIGISGGLASGKTTAGEYFKDNGYAYARFSMIIEELVNEEGQIPTRARLQEMGKLVHKAKGQRWLCQKLFQTFLTNEKHIVIDGLRFPEDHAFMRERFGPHFTHIHLTCDDAIRKVRYEGLARNDTPFEVAISHDVERAVSELSKLADKIIVNEKDLNTLFKQLRQQLVG